MGFLKKVGLGYLPLIKVLVYLLFAAVSIVGISIAISYPLWWLALHETRTYTLGALMIMGSALIWVMFIRPLVRSKESFTRQMKKLGTSILWVLLPIGLLLGGYGIVVLIKTGSPALGLILLFPYLIFVGYLLYYVQRK